ncbi:hypothetical protein ACA910_008179 [Epithemia clementina (nom. ined.)]
MPSLGTFLLVHVFTAVLPPKEADNPEKEYYHVLGLPTKRSTSSDDIRKAYRKLSLELHPDKIAQRGSRSKYTAVEAAALYERVQEAYTVLNDKKERAKYHSVNCSVARYKFIYQQGWMHPLSILENISKASCWDKFRLVLVAMTIMFVFLLQPILIAAKINADLEDSGPLQHANWNLILIPFWIIYALFALMQLVVFCLSKQRSALFAFFQHVCILVGAILLVREWERAEGGRPRDSVNWNRLSTPFYLAVFMKTAAISERLKALWRIHDKLVSPDKIVTLVQEQMQQQQKDKEQRQGQTPAGGGEDDQGLTEDQMEELLRQTFVVVTPNDLSFATSLALLEQAGGESLTEEEVELLKVQSSPEYQHLQEQISQTSSGVAHVMVYGVTIIALIAAKLEDNIQASWWLVFLPVWIYFGWQLFKSCFTCCCLTSAVEVEDDEGDAVEDDGQPDDNDTAKDDEDEEYKDAEKGKKPNKTVDAKKATGNRNDESEDSKDVNESRDDVDDVNKKSSNGGGESGALIPDADQQSAGTAIKVDPLKSEPKESVTLFQTANSFQTPEVAKELEEKTNKESAEYQPKNEEGEQDKGLDDDDDHPFDSDAAEEAFREWQRAHAQAADNAVQEAHARAHWTFCTSIFYLVTICLMVAKLEDVDDGDDGFNTFWILFPTFFIAGLLVCCFCCLVYSAPDVAKMEELLRQQEHPGEQQQGQEGGQSPPHADVEQGTNNDATIILPSFGEVGPAGEEKKAGSSSHHSGTAPAPAIITTDSQNAAAVEESASNDKKKDSKKKKKTEATTTATTNDAPQTEQNEAADNTPDESTPSQEAGAGDINDLD